MRKFKTLMISMLLLLTTLLHIPITHATECGDLVKEIRTLELPAFDEYPRLNDMKQDVLLILYGRERGTCPSELSEFSQDTKSFMEEFNEAYVIAKSSAEGEDHMGVVTTLIALKEETDGLSSLRESAELGIEGEDIVNSARESIQAFLQNEAENYFAIEAENVIVTRTKIAYYEEAALAYEEADASLEAANNRIKAQALQRRLDEDLDKANNLRSTALSKHEKAIELQSQDIISKINAYILTSQALGLFREARTYYEFHREDEMVTQVDEDISLLRKTMIDLAKVIGIYFLITAIGLIAVISFLINRLKRWATDSYDITLGNELIKVIEHET